MPLDDLMIELKARGNWGHGGRPGKRGGSSPGGGLGAKVKIDKKSNLSNQEVNQLVDKLRKRGYQPFTSMERARTQYSGGDGMDIREFRKGSHVIEIGSSNYDKSTNKWWVSEKNDQTS